jgi:hypothetical protein
VVSGRNLSEVETADKRSNAIGTRAAEAEPGLIAQQRERLDLLIDYDEEGSPHSPYIPKHGSVKNRTRFFDFF